MTDRPFLGRREVVRALTMLGARLAAIGLVGDLYVVGGAAMVLAYHAERMTRDVDAVFAPAAEIYEAARDVGEELGLPSGWLNDAAKGFVPGPDPGRLPVLDVPGLRVTAASAEYLLGMKLLAARAERDREDIAQLADMMGLGDADSVLQVVARLYPPALLMPRTRFLVEEMFTRPADGSSDHESTGSPPSSGRGPGTEP